MTEGGILAAGWKGFRFPQKRRLSLVDSQGLAVGMVHHQVDGMEEGNQCAACAVLYTAVSPLSVSNSSS